MMMKRPIWLAAALLAPAPALAQTPQPMASQAPQAAPLPIRSVTLFTSGVAYIERGGEVDGNATVPLQFRTAQINDILKSLVLLDEKGTVQPATYAARDPIGRTLQSFAVDVTQPLGRAELLNRLRGARVTVETGREALTGQIVGVEQKPELVGERQVMVETLTLLGERGLQSVRLDDVKTIRLLDARLDREFREALGILASGSDEQRRQVTLRFDGTGRRQVRVGYVTEAPLWKMSYRLLLGGKDGTEKPYLQGWALVENTTDDDWQNVGMALVSGRPISFIQDLYQPLYLPRPVVAPDVVASPTPQTHGGDLQEEKPAPVAANEPAEAGEAAGEERLRRTPAPALRPAAPTVGGLGGRGYPGGGGGLAFMDTPTLFRQSVAAQASGQSAGALFRYDITTPVSLPRQQAAMIPVVAQDIEAEKVALYNADVDPRFPLNAVRVINNTKLHLKGGPVTLFDAGTYAGDAKMEDIPPGDNRLVSYAVDLSVEGERQGPGVTTVETSLALRRGVLTITRRERQETTYTLKSRAQKPITVLVEHPFQPERNLVQPGKATERTANLYRFAVPVAPGKSETLKVVTEQPIAQTIAVLDADMDSLAFMANRKDIAPRLREALGEVVRRRRRVQELQNQASNRQNEIGAIMQDQERIRKNMTALDKNSALYKRYVAELDRQETRIQTLRAEASRFRNEAAAAERDLRAFLDTLEIAGE